MSLKAKLEAVIYAAEEPVTLAQLAWLFAEDAFAWKAERETRNLELALSVNTAAEADETAGASDSTRELADLIEVVEAAVEAQAESSAPQPAATQEETAHAATETPGLPPQSDARSSADIDPELEAKRLERSRDREARLILREVLDELIAEYAQDSRGIEIREIAGGFRMGTKPEIHDSVRAFVKSLKPPLKLSLPALETLAVIAYKQPVTAPEVGEIRGVDSAGVLGSLMSRKLIATAGRKQVIGRPILYKTTREFLLRFGLKDLNELPSMEEFEKMAALELSEESLDEESTESSDSAGPVEQTGELFPESEGKSADSTEEDEPVGTSGTSETEEAHEAVRAVSTPTAETSEEAAEAQALVERQNAEEVEVER
jgi:segregation and condensation protein B